MIPEAPFLFSLAGLNASLAGLGGLLVALRRGPELEPLETLRLRQVIEFAFANVLLAIALQPAIALLGADAGLRAAGGASVGYVLLSIPILHRRVARVGIAWGPVWAASAVGLSLAGVAVGTMTMANPSGPLYELLLVVMLGRPMVTFLLVLGTIDQR